MAHLVPKPVNASCDKYLKYNTMAHLDLLKATKDLQHNTFSFDTQAEQAGPFHTHTKGKRNKLKYCVCKPFISVQNKISLNVYQDVSSLTDKTKQNK